MQDLHLQEDSTLTARNQLGTKMGEVAVPRRVAGDAAREEEDRRAEILRIRADKRTTCPRTGVLATDRANPR
jgi:hypothetical protein